MYFFLCFLEVAKEYVTREFSDFMVKCGTELEALSQLHESLGNENANQIICLDSVPTEDLSLVNLVRSDHEELRKVVLALGHLVSEVCVFFCDYALVTFNIVC